MWLVLAEAGGSGGLNLWKILLDASPISKLVFVLLIGCSVLSVAVLVERWIVLNRIQRSTMEALQALDSWAMARQWDEARQEIGRSLRETCPLFSVLRSGIANWQELVAVGETNMEVLESAATDAMNRELKLVRAHMRANLPILANIASTAPFIGLFGTVVGIILTFDTIAKQGNMGQDLVASGIADALVATAMGLFAAIPALLAYNHFNDQIGKLILTLEEVAMERIFYLVQGERTREPARVLVKE
ncbi:MAG: MotA/TolQ/ExbB proton channel family protein [Armatimonadota bacterium]